MVRVLMTGMTLQQCGLEDRVKLKYCSAPPLLRQAARDAGHEVDARPVALGEDLSRYDCAVVGLANMLSFGSRFALGALWAAASLPHCYLLDDWNVGATFGSIRGCARGRPEESTIRSVLPRDGRDQYYRYWRELASVLAQLSEAPWERPTLAPFFAWGRHDAVKADTMIGELWPFDPSSYQPQYCKGLRPVDEKDRSWVLASLPNHDKWVTGLGLSWPVWSYGHLKSGKPRLWEWQVVQGYASSWGVLSPRYEHAGSGWWRARFKYAADVLSILLADPEEVIPIGGAYSYAAEEYQMLEHCPVRDLVYVAGAQRAALYDQMWQRQAMLDWADGTVRRVARDSSPLTAM